MDVNPVQAWVDGVSKALEADRARSQMTLGQLIAELKRLDPSRLIWGLGEPESYRGYYSDLAFEPTDEVREVRDLLDSCRGCMGRVFKGYKGGDFPMHARTPLWVASYGCLGKRLMGLDTKSAPIRPLTEPEEW